MCTCYLKLMLKAQKKHLILSMQNCHNKNMSEVRQTLDGSNRSKINKHIYHVSNNGYDMHFTIIRLGVIYFTFFLISCARTCASRICDFLISPTRNRRQYSPSRRHITAFLENRSVVLRFLARASFANIRPTYGQEKGFEYNIKTEGSGT